MLVLDWGDGNHDCYVCEVDDYHAEWAPEAVDIASTNAFTEENAVVIVIFDANTAIWAVVGIVINHDLAVSAPLSAWFEIAWSLALSLSPASARWSIAAEL